MRPFLIAVLLTLAGDRAWAEDFSGFYAGVNAGTAFGRDRTAVGGPRPAEARAAVPGNPAADLPPSAAGAAAAMQKSGRPEAGSARR